MTRFKQAEDMVFRRRGPEKFRRKLLQVLAVGMVVVYVLSLSTSGLCLIPAICPIQLTLRAPPVMSGHN